MSKDLRRLQNHLIGTTSLYACVVAAKQVVKAPVFVRLSGNAKITFRGNDSISMPDLKCKRVIAKGRPNERRCNRRTKRGFEYCKNCLDMPTIMKELAPLATTEILTPCKWVVAMGRPNERPCPKKSSKSHGYCDKCAALASVKKLMSSMSG